MAMSFLNHDISFDNVFFVYLCGRKMYPSIHLFTEGIIHTVYPITRKSDEKRGFLTKQVHVMETLEF